METALLFVCIVAGYCFSVIFLPSLYSAAREEGHRLYFRAGYYAVFLVIVSIEIYLIAFFYGCPVAHSDHTFYTNLSFIPLVHKILEGNNAEYMISLLAFALGITTPHAFNFVLRILRLKSILVHRALKDDDFEKMLLYSAEQTVPILVTLNSFKTYVGWCTKLENPIVDRKYLKLLPILSGYRHNLTHEPVFTTDYQPIYNKIRNKEPSVRGIFAEAFEVLISLDQVVSIHKYDLVVQQVFQSLSPPGSGFKNENTNHETAKDSQNPSQNQTTDEKHDNENKSHPGKFTITLAVGRNKEK